MIQLNQRPIRVMRIIARMNIGGPAVQVAGLMRRFDSVKFNQQLYTGYCGADEADYLEMVASDVEAIRITGLGRRVSFRGDVKAFTALVKAIRDFKPDVIHTHTAKAGFLGRLASIISLHPSILVHTYHGHLLNGYFGKFQCSLVILAEKLLGLFTDELLAVGNKVRKDLLKAGIGKVENFGLMPPGLEIAILPNKSESMNALGLNPLKLQCGYIGRVTRIKRPDRFLDTVSEIKSRGLEIDFFIAGDGELLDYCKERIDREKLPVKILGWQPNIEKILAVSDLIILTSDNEGTPLSLIQAGMAGIPVVATNVGSVSEVVLDGVTGIVCPLDVMSIANAIEKLAVDRALRNQLSYEARKFTLANFGVSRLAHDHEELYQRLLFNRAKF